MLKERETERKITWESWNLNVSFNKSLVCMQNSRKAEKQDCL